MFVNVTLDVCVDTHVDVALSFVRTWNTIEPPRRRLRRSLMTPVLNVVR